MLFLRKPNAARVERFLSGQALARPTYDPSEASTACERRFALDVHRTIVGCGYDAFLAAREALRSWRHLQLPWVEAYPSSLRVAEGSEVALLAHHYGFWSLNACRVASISSEDDTRQVWGFTYRTLSAHMECGEERFVVEFDSTRGLVVYEIAARSRPSATIARVGYPVTRRVQARFRLDSGVALKAAVTELLAVPLPNTVEHHS